MKKFLKIFFISLILSLIVFVFVCSLVIPAQTKETLNYIIDFLNKPLPIIGISVLTLGGIVIVIISKLGFGSKQIKELKKEYYEFKDKVEKEKEYAEECYKKSLEIEESVKAMLQEFYNQNDIIIEELIKVCQTIPNAKIKAIGEEIKDRQKEMEYLGLEDKSKGLGVQDGEETTND